MQINKWWAGRSVPVPGTSGIVIDWERVRWEWTYNVVVGMAIYDDELRGSATYLANLGMKNPTEEQLRLNALSRYNGGGHNNYYEKDADGNIVRKKNCDTCNYADKVNATYNSKSWINSPLLQCQKSQ
jgi:hypothetical protein